MIFESCVSVAPWVVLSLPATAIHPITRQRRHVCVWVGAALLSTPLLISAPHPHLTLAPVRERDREGGGVLCTVPAVCHVCVCVSHPRATESPRPALATTKTKDTCGA